MSIRYIRTVRQSAAQGLVRAVYEQIRREFGVLGEPLVVHSPIPGLLAGVWCACREAILAGVVPRHAKESIAVAVSRLNECPYCMDAHTVLLRAAGAHEAADAIRNDEEDSLADPGLRRIVGWASSTRAPGPGVFKNRPFSTGQAPEFIGTAFWIHYINRIATVFLDPRLIRIPGRLSVLRAAAERIGGMYFSRTVAQRLVPGASLPLLDGIRCIPPSWAAPAPPISAAFGALAAGAEEAGQKATCAETRAWAESVLSGWQGNSPGMSRSWLDVHLRELDPDLRPEGTLVMLAAMAPYQVDEDVIDRFRRARPGDTNILGAVSWGAFRAAERIASWL
jgi:AhpD family alkylhydroperoxidase